jgi:hypothetical protein
MSLLQLARRDKATRLEDGEDVEDAASTDPSAEVSAQQSVITQVPAFYVPWTLPTSLFFAVL